MRGWNAHSRPHFCESSETSCDSEALLAALSFAASSAATALALAARSALCAALAAASAACARASRRVLVSDAASAASRAECISSSICRSSGKAASALDAASSCLDASSSMQARCSRATSERSKSSRSAARASAAAKLACSIFICAACASIEAANTASRSAAASFSWRLAACDKRRRIRHFGHRPTVCALAPVCPQRNWRRAVCARSPLGQPPPAGSAAGRAPPRTRAAPVAACAQLAVLLLASAQAPRPRLASLQETAPFPRAPPHASRSPVRRQMSASVSALCATQSCLACSVKSLDESLSLRPQQDNLRRRGVRHTPSTRCRRTVFSAVPMRSSHSRLRSSSSSCDATAGELAAHAEPRPGCERRHGRGRMLCAPPAPQTPYPAAAAVAAGVRRAVVSTVMSTARLWCD